jgi:hypothetical protein
LGTLGSVRGAFRHRDLAKNDAYGQLPPAGAHGNFLLSNDYVTTATNDVALQLSKAGVRLATILNRVLRKP